MSLLYLFLLPCFSSLKFHKSLCESCWEPVAAPAWTTEDQLISFRRRFSQPHGRPTLQKTGVTMGTGNYTCAMSMTRLDMVTQFIDLRHFFKLDSAIKHSFGMLLIPASEAHCSLHDRNARSKYFKVEVSSSKLFSDWPCRTRSKCIRLSQNAVFVLSPHCKR